MEGTGDNISGIRKIGEAAKAVVTGRPGGEQLQLRIEDSAVASITPTIGEGVSKDLKGQDGFSCGKNSIAVADGVSGAPDSQATIRLAQEVAERATHILDAACLGFDLHGSFSKAIKYIREKIADLQREELSKHRGSAATTLIAVGKIADKYVTVRIGDSEAYLVRPVEQNADGTYRFEASEIDSYQTTFDMSAINRLSTRNAPEEVQATFENMPYTIGAHNHPAKISVRQARKGDRIVVASDGPKSQGIGMIPAAARCRTVGEFEEEMRTKMNEIKDPVDDLTITIMHIGQPGYIAAK